MPHGIEASGGSGDWGKEGVAKPDDKDGVLLTESLTGFHTLALMGTYPLAKGELEKPRQKGD